MRTARLTLLCLLVSIATACTTPSTSDGAAAIGGASSEPSAANHQACLTNAKALEVAADAYFAMTGEYPSSQQQLVDNGLIREPVEALDVVATGAGYDIVAVGPVCEGFDA